MKYATCVASWFCWARNVIKACKDRETARRLGREQWETACMDGWPFWVVRMPAYGSFHLNQNVHLPIKYLVISYGRVPTDWTNLLHKTKSKYQKSVDRSVVNLEYSKKKKLEQEMAPAGGYSWEFLLGVCRPVLQMLTQFQTKKFNFPHPFSDQTSKIHTRFETWPLGRNCYHYLD